MNSNVSMKFMSDNFESLFHDGKELTLKLNRDGVLRAVKALASGETAELILTEKGVTLNMSEKDWLYDAEC